MMGGGETLSGDQDGLHTAVQVPIGWQRRVEGGRVLYVSPSGTSLSSVDEVKTYLLTDGTCKCGLECPLVLHKVFSFAVGVKVEQSSLPVGKPEQDMTKLCNHRRKVVAMAALCHSMQASQLPFSGLPPPVVGRGVDSRHPKKPVGEREEHLRLYPVPQRAHTACVSPQSPRHFVYPQNGSSPVLHHPLDPSRRLHHPAPPRTPTPHSTCPSQRTPKTPDTPGSLNSPPSSSPMALAGVRSAPNHHTPLSSPMSRTCVSPQQRSRHPSASPSPLPEQSPLSPLPSPNPHLPKYRLEDILEQFKHSASTISPALLHQSHEPVSHKSLLCRPPHTNTHPPFVQPHAVTRAPHSSSFPASSLLSAAAKAQLVNQVNQGCVSVDSSLEAFKEAQQHKVKTQADGVDTLIPLPLQSKDNPLLQQLLPTLLNPTVLGDLSNITGLQNLVGLGAGSILLPPVQGSPLGMPLLQSPDGTINLLNNLQLSIATSPEEEKVISSETQSPASQEDIPTNQTTPEAQSPEGLAPIVPHRAVGAKPVIDPYTSFMDTIYTSFLQVSAREQEEGSRSSPFCALPPFPLESLSPPTPLPSFPMETLSPPPLPQASAPVSLSPRRACSLRNPDLSRLSLEAAAHSPAQGTPKPTEDRKTLPPIYLEEAQTDCSRPAAVCPYTDGRDRKRLLPSGGYLHPGDACSQDSSQILLLDQHASDALGGLGEARRGRKRKQLLQNVLEDFRDLDESKATVTLLKSERSVRGRRRRGTRSQRQ